MPSHFASDCRNEFSLAALADKAADQQKTMSRVLPQNRIENAEIRKPGKNF